MSARDTRLVQLVLKAGLPDVEGARVRQEAARDLGLATGRVHHTRLFLLPGGLDDATLRRFARDALADAVLHDVYVDEAQTSPAVVSSVLVAKQPGVTDDEGASVATALADFLGEPLPAGRRCHSQDLYLFERQLADADLRRIAEELLGNVLVHHFEVGPLERTVGYVPRVRLAADPTVEPVDVFVDDEALLALSRRRVLSLDLAEMRAVAAHHADLGVRAARRAAGLPEPPTDCELEVLAQTWSEHCKHKEFRALIHFSDLDTGEREEVDSLFDTFVAGATQDVRGRLEAAGHDWLVKVFSDNAGVVRVDEDRLFVFKVETHNTPSALDPYGGAITGILGNNRDPLGTGRGGGRLLFNTDVLCFGPQDWDGPLLSGQLHPARVMRGVRRGIEDGGNKSGVPTVHGAVVFDARYRGKPLVYCGTGAVMPAAYQGLASWEKEIRPGDRILMAGGRVGADGIHGATFSSGGLDEDSPRSAVQVGSPFTQKRLADFLEEACAAGLVRCCTDNGAGGLASSVGELAPLAGGARVELERVPLKYPGLRPWEVFVSESQERMTLVVDPVHNASVAELAARHEVEVADIGVFDDGGFLDVRWEGRPVARLDLEFLHHGVPRKELWAEWQAPELAPPELPEPLDHAVLLSALLASPDVCSREAIIRQYDHEVKGKTVVKPLMGPTGHAPQDAAVLLLDHEGWAGLGVSCGIVPHYGDLDPYQMSAGAFDEAVRQLVAVGCPLPLDPGGGFWSVCDNFCVPDSAFDPEHNPDGRRKLGALVLMCRALHDVASAYDVPLTSGKDSMKNDLVADGEKISVPPTVLFSAVAGMADVRRAVTTDVKSPGDLVYLLGETYDELGGGVLLRLLGQLGDRVPVVRTAAARELYRRVAAAHAGGLLASCHDLSDGGLAVALAESAFGGDLGLSVRLPAGDLSSAAWLYAESHSRFLATVRPEDREAFEAILGDRATRLGEVTGDRRLRVGRGDEALLDVAAGVLRSAWARGLEV